MRFESDKLNGYGAQFPGTDALSLDVGKGEQEFGLVSLYAAVPRMSLGAFVRFNLFSELMGTRQHIASAICPEGTTGELIVVSGHLADSWHVTVQASDARQDVKVGLVALQCCASPAVRVRADLLALAFADFDEDEPQLNALMAPPLVPWGVEFGALQVETVSGSGVLVTPKGGARLIHWEAMGAAPGPGSITFTQSVVDGTFQTITVGVGEPKREGFPNGTMPITEITYTSLDFGLFEWVF